MPHTIATIGSQLASSGTEVLESMGIRAPFTAAYPDRSTLLDFMRTERPEAIIIRLVEMIDGEIMDASPALKVIVKHGVGTNDIDLEAAKARGIAVLAATAANAQSVAEHALGFILALTKDFHRQDSRIRNGVWDKSGYAGRELKGQTLGLVGFGQIARLLASFAQVIGLDVVAYDPFAPDTAFTSFRRISDIDELLSISDIVSLHTPLLPETRNLISANRLAKMKRGALLINTARGEIVDEDALADALESGQLSGAGLDSFATEPPTKSRLWSMDNVIMTPHVAGVTADAKSAISRISAANASAFLSGEPIDAKYVVAAGNVPASARGHTV